MQKFLFGDAPTLRDLVLIHLAAIGAAALLALVYMRSAEEISLLALAVIVLLSLDEAGGIVANATRSANDWYHNRSMWLSYAFVAVNTLQPLLMVLFLGLPSAIFALLAGYQLLAGCLLVTLRGHALQIPLAAALLSSGLVLFVALSPGPPVITALGILYLVKLVFVFPVNLYPAATRRSSTL